MKPSKATATTVAFLLLATLAWAAGTVMSVQVREGHVRAGAAFLSPIVSTLGYGDRVTVLETQDVWTSISTESGKTGWMHASALTPKEIVMEATAEDVQAAASGKEIALAGKGFNKQVEDQYRAEHTDLDYGKVDQMESRVVSIKEIQAFLAQGEVKEAQ